MSFRATAFRRSQWTGLLLALTSLSVFGQAADSPIVFNNTSAITTTFVQAPNIGTSSGGAGSSQWLKIEFRFSVTLPKDVPGNYLDSAEFKVWVEGIDMVAADAPVPGKGLAVALTGSVKYVNLPVSRDVYGVFYVPPGALGRYSKLSPSDFDREFNIHIEATSGGKYCDRYDKKKETDENWYKALKPVSGMVFRQNQCPFIISDPDRYPSIALPDSSSSSDSSAPPDASTSAPSSTPATNAPATPAAP